MTRDEMLTEIGMHLLKEVCPESHDVVLAVLQCEARRIIREWPACRPGASGRVYTPKDPVAHAAAVQALRAVNARILERRRQIAVD